MFVVSPYAPFAAIRTAVDGILGRKRSLLRTAEPVRHPLQSGVAQCSTARLTGKREERKRKGISIKI